MLLLNILVIASRKQDPTTSHVRYNKPDDWPTTDGSCIVIERWVTKSIEVYSPVPAQYHYHTHTHTHTRGGKKIMVPEIPVWCWWPEWVSFDFFFSQSKTTSLLVMFTQNEKIISSNTNRFRTILPVRISWKIKKKKKYL